MKDPCGNRKKFKRKTKAEHSWPYKCSLTHLLALCSPSPLPFCFQAPLCTMSLLFVRIKPYWSVFQQFYKLLNLCYMLNFRAMLNFCKFKEVYMIYYTHTHIILSKQKYPSLPINYCNFHYLLLQIYNFTLKFWYTLLFLLVFLNSYD